MGNTHGATPQAAEQARVWDERHRAAETVPQPAQVLVDWAHLLPPGGRALDLACGLGGNALWLAERCFRVCAWDLSPVAIERLSALAADRGLTLETEVRDLTAKPPEPNAFDLIVVTHFLDRDLAPAIAAALRPGGMLFYQTFNREPVSVCGPTNPAYRLAPNELLELFHGLVVRIYRDEGRLGDTRRGLRDLAQLVAERPG
jgi:2-polyprenyl-3-methyl-5-hydroxy-6-metoxy-1,4-benzoquinol methylase